MHQGGGAAPCLYRNSNQPRTRKNVKARNMRKQEAEGASGARTKAAVDCLDTFKQKEEEKAGVAGWGSAERHLWSPVRCEPRERSQSDLIFSASDDTNGKPEGRFCQCGVAASPPHGDKQLPAVTTSLRPGEALCWAWRFRVVTPSDVRSN